MSLTRALFLVLVAALAGAYALWRSLPAAPTEQDRSAPPEPRPAPRRWRPTRPGPAPRPRAARPRRYAVEHTTPTVRLPHLAAALEVEARLTDGADLARVVG